MNFKRTNQKSKTDIEMNFLCDDVGIYTIRPFLFSHVSISADSHNYCYTTDQEESHLGPRVKILLNVLGILSFSFLQSVLGE